MKIGFLYGGQGSQREGMGLDFYQQIEEAGQIYDSFPYADFIKEVSFEYEMKRLSETQYAQPALVAYQVMLTQLLENQGIHPEGYCGLSIGEYSALYGAGVIRPKDAIEIAKFRGEVMDKDAKAVDTAMLAVLHKNESEVLALLEEERVADRIFISNINSSQQIVLGGESEDIERLAQSLKAKKIRAIKLKTEAAFHTKFMSEASEKLGDFLQRIDFQIPQSDLYLNLTGRLYEGEDFRQTFTKQVKETVRLADDLNHMIQDGYDCFIEIAPSSVFEKLLGKIAPHVKVYPVTTVDDYKKVVEELNGK
ncbi:ACP S-malonyltransferase [Atopobacter sp. AH10]|uniref:ACP S-malonyltransferase n=1 Tax=Atopobacter sp. AH10 TaxID=2315861 RepID=UPI000EF1917C|nr:ACP S-malonyltransferase [Atopobacter sp. AH10]RLK63055.1 ACP S-malonyltransferase [Atopobacter sp. AH10]